MNFPMSIAMALTVSFTSFTGCKQVSNEPKVQENKIAEEEPYNNLKKDSLVKFIEYVSKNNSFKIDALTNEALYYRTEKEKYRVLANKNYDSMAFYGKLAGRFQPK